MPSCWLIVQATELFWMIVSLLPATQIDADAVLQTWPAGGHPVVAFGPPYAASFPSIRPPLPLTIRMSSPPEYRMLLFRIRMLVGLAVPSLLLSGVTATAMRSTWSKVLLATVTSFQVETGVVWSVWTATPAFDEYQPPAHPEMLRTVMFVMEMPESVVPEEFSTITPVLYAGEAAASWTSRPESCHC